MNIAEFRGEFIFKYDAASNGGPDLNNYEISLCLTQANKDIISDNYLKYESDEKCARVLSPLLKEHNSSITLLDDLFWYGKSFLISLPNDLRFILSEQVKLKNCTQIPEIRKVPLDMIERNLKNPFKRPSKKRIIRSEYNKTEGKVFSIEDLEDYRIKYIKNPRPIIVSNFIDDEDLIGDETIDGISVVSETELPELVHDEIIDKAVIIAIKISRENGLQSQIQVK